MLRERTGLVADPYFSATKLEWLLRDAALRRRAERGELAAGTVESWLVARLTGGRVHVTDHTNASRTLLYRLAARDWDAELLDLFGVPRALLPDIVRSSGVVAESDPGLLGASFPIAGLAGDQQSALFGQGCCRDGLAKNTYGTGAFLLVYHRQPAAPAGRRGCWRRRPAAPTASRPSRSKAACSSPAPRCSGCATVWVSSAPRGKPRRLPAAFRIRAGCTSFRPSSASARRTGTPTPGGRSPASPAGPPALSWSAPRSRPWRSAARSCWRP